jgi:uncharacterized protein YuzE
MSNASSFNVLYDRDSDVLYISKRSEAAGKGIESPHGVVWRYNINGELIGVTVIDYHDRWNTKQTELISAIADRFNIPQSAARRVLDHAKDF